MTESDIRQIIARLRRVKTDISNVEAKAAQSELLSHGPCYRPHAEA